MSAEPIPNSPNQRKDAIQRFKENYAVALADAHISAAHTATEGWQRLFAGERQRRRDAQRSLSIELKALALRMEERGLDEEEEKRLGETKKESVLLRESCIGFDVRTVDPVRRPVRECDKLIEEAMHLARHEESEAPLVNVGLEEIMRHETKKVARPRWDDELGCVVVEESAL